MKRYDAAEHKVVIGQVEKSPTEIVRVIRQRLNGYELVSLPVFSCGCKSATVEKGLSLHLEQWRAVVPMIQRGLDLGLYATEEPEKSFSSVVIGQIDKNTIEILRVEYQLLNGDELISLKVFSCRRAGRRVAEKGVSLYLNQWRELLPMIQAGLEMQFPEKPLRKPSRSAPVTSEKVTDSEHLDLGHWRPVIKETFSQVSAAYPAGCLDWLRENNSDRIAALKATVKEAERAFLAKDARALDAALAHYRAMHLATFEEFQNR